MFDLHLIKNGINRITGTPDGIKHAFHRCGITNVANAKSLIEAISAIQPKKSMYIDRADDCVRIYAHVEYYPMTFMKRLNALKGQLQFLNAPHLLLVEGLASGNGIDFMLTIQNQYAHADDLQLAVVTTDADIYFNAVAKPTTISIFNSYGEAISALKKKPEINELETDYVVRNRRYSAKRHTAEFEVDAKTQFKDSDFYFKINTFTDGTDGISLDVICFEDQTLRVAVLTKTEIV